MPIVSIIVPVYKTEEYLEKCVNSILQQTLEDIEIILVDDGSPDKCPYICDKLALIDRRIKVIHKTNGGLSDARNAALDIATGKYIGFVDSDDFISNTMFEKMYKKIESTHSDICICAHYTVSNGDSIPHLLPYDLDLYTKNDINNYFIAPLIGESSSAVPKTIDGFVCRQLFKKDIIKSIRFKSEKKYFAEDVVFDFEIYQKANSISILNEPLYYYVYNKKSLSNKYRDNIWICLYNLLEYKQSVIDGLRLYDNINDRFTNEIIKFVIVSIHNLNMPSSPLKKKEIITEIKKISNSKYGKHIKRFKVIRQANIKTALFLIALKFRMYSLIILLFK